MKGIRMLVASVALAVFSTGASAQRVMKYEPPQGELRGGQFVYVDNGKCPKGQILKVTAGVRVGRMVSGGGGVPREKVCVARPSGV
ncbi:hypothetical protein GCM10007036_10080 [Alsobacter metallidurans]|uniref:Secreted protein n=1 Tax=Alsobacter metallidurans TaxID=340221 RepID=A0A917MG19_9HYPH|nr:DUF6719 family protein [Alsobacter metallidurans]GGH12340.1 hypothetical protein GCM10007036_10080 [Alsobacter metallidurans]